MTGHGNRWTRERVTALRSHHKIPVLRPAPDGKQPWLNLNKAARLLGIAPKHHRQPEREERRKRGARIDPPGYDAGKKIKGKKRHLLVDTRGLLLHAVVHPADIQDRDGGILLLSTLFGIYPFLEKLFADSAYAGHVFDHALLQILPQLKTEIVKRSDRAQGFVVLPKRWIVERTIACDARYPAEILGPRIG